MKRRLKLKVNGESPRSLLLAYFLAKFNCDVYMYDCLTDSNAYKNEEIFSFTNFSKNLLSEFDIWNEFKDISYGFTSCCIKDDLVSEQLLFRAKNFYKNSFNNIGWTTNCSDIRNLLIDKLFNFENVYFISKNQLNDQSFTYDYEFNFNSFEKFSTSIFKRKNQDILIFNVFLRGNVDKRLYEINTSKGLLVLIPLDKNLYQIIWNNTPIEIKEGSLKSKNLFLDNLTTLLPNDLKIDQIIGNINCVKTHNISRTFLIRNKSIYFNENKFISNTLYELNFDIFIKNVLEIFNFLEVNKLKYRDMINKVYFFYFLRKYAKFKINISSYNFLINLFISNNIFILFFRKVLFTLFKKINISKMLIDRIIKNCNTNNLIK